jgi:uncharacterized protein (DUF1330 family)
MSAYLIYVCHDVSDRKELETYWGKSQPTFEGQSMNVLAAYTPFEVLEGDEPVQGIVIAEFPSMESTRGWFHGPAYTEARKHRNRGADYLGLLIDGGVVTEIEKRMPQTRK